MKTLTLTASDDMAIAAEYTALENSHKAVIFAHGMTGSKDTETVHKETERRLHDAGISTLSFDFRAHGKSSGDPVKQFTISGELLDLEAAVMYMKQQGYPWIGLVGSSFGGGVASLFAGAHAEIIQALCLVNPVLEFEEAFLNPTTPWTKRYFTDAQNRMKQDGYLEIGESKYHIGPDLLEEMKEYTPYDLLEKYYGALLFVQGTEDEILNHQEIYTQFINLELDTKQIEIINGAKHGFHEDPYTQEAAELIADFFVSPT